MSNSNNADWNKMKTDYVTTHKSMRELSAEYGVSLHTIGKRASKEKWVEQREQFGNKRNEKAQQKAIEKLANKDVEHMTRIGEISSFLLDKIEKAAREELGFTTVKDRETAKEAWTTPDGIRHETSKTTEHARLEQCTIDIGRASQITRALKDLTEVIALTSGKNANESQAFEDLMKLIEGGDELSDT